MDAAFPPTGTPRPAARTGGAEMIPMAFPPERRPTAGAVRQ